MYLLTMWLVEVGVAINIMDKKVAINIWTHHFAGTSRLSHAVDCWHSVSEITFAPITFRYSKLSLSNSLDCASVFCLRSLQFVFVVVVVNCCGWILFGYRENFV